MRNFPREFVDVLEALKSPFPIFLLKISPHKVSLCTISYNTVHPLHSPVEKVRFCCLLITCEFFDVFVISAMSGSDLSWFALDCGQCEE